MIGLLAEYLGLVYEEVKARSNFTGAEMLGLPDHGRSPPRA
jgi:hypothetical protein